MIGNVHDFFYFLKKVFRIEILKTRLSQTQAAGKKFVPLIIVIHATVAYNARARSDIQKKKQTKKRLGQKP